MTTTFIGVDLAWKVDCNHTGCAVLKGTGKDARLAAISSGIRSFQALVEFIETHATVNTVVAIDGPLVVTNHSGQRPCETEMARRFGRSPWLALFAFPLVWNFNLGDGFIAYCAGTGGSILIIGSAAGVTAMGLEQIRFFWYVRRISGLALLGYFGGAAVYVLQYRLLH